MLACKANWIGGESNLSSRDEGAGADAVPTGGQPKDEFEVALDTWNKMDLAEIAGFPTWEAEVFELLKGDISTLPDAEALSACTDESHDCQLEYELGRRGVNMYWVRVPEGRGVGRWGWYQSY